MESFADNDTLCATFFRVVGVSVAESGKYEYSNKRGNAPYKDIEKPQFFPVFKEGFDNNIEEKKEACNEDGKPHFSLEKIATEEDGKYGQERKGAGA